MNTAALRAPAHSQVYTGRLAPFVRERRRTRIPGLELLRTFRPPGDISAPAASDFGLVVALGRAPYECDVNAGGVRYRGAIRRGDAYLRLAGVPTEAHGLSAQDALVVPLPITVLSPGLQSARADARAFDSLQGRPFRDPLLLAVLERLWDEAAEGNPLDALYAEAGMLVVTAILLKQSGGAADPRAAYRKGGLPPRQLQRALDYMQAQLDRDVTLAELAGLVDLSPHHFCRAFKISTGLPPHAWLLHRRVERAQTLLLDPALSLTEIALATSYASQSAMGSAFRRVTGTSPGAWRRQRLM